MRNTISNLLTPKGRWLPTLLLLFTLGIGQMWGAASTTTDNKSITGTVTFDSFGSMSNATCYWYNGVKVFENATGTASKGTQAWSTDVTYPCYAADIVTGKDGTAKNNKWGNSEGNTPVWSMSGLVLQRHCLAVHVNSAGTITLIVNNNTNTDVDVVPNLAAKIDNVAYATAYTTSNYLSGTGDALTLSSSRSDATNKKCRYTVSYTVKTTDLTDGEAVIKFYYGSSGTGAGKIFCYESVSFTPATVTKHSVTYDLNGGTGTTPTQADVAENAKFTLHDGTTSITAPSGQQFAGWNDGTKTYLGGAEYTMGTSDVELTAQWETAKTDPTATFSNSAYVVGASALDLSGLFTSQNTSAVTFALKVASEDATVSGSNFTATKEGSYVIVATQPADANYKAVSKEATMVVTYPATGSATIIYNVAVGTSQTSLATASKEDNSASISNLVGFTAVEIATRSGGGKTASSPKLETPATKVQGKYVYVTFDVANGKEFVLDSVVTKMVAVYNSKTFEIVVSDTEGTKDSLNYEQGSNSDPGTAHQFNFTSSVKAYQGTVTIKIYAYGSSANDYRIGKPLKVCGKVQNIPTPSAPSISAPDADQAAVYDLNDVIAPLEITASGYPTPTYQWYSNSSASTDGATAIEGAQSASYTPANNVASDLYYYCVATNSQGTATSHYFHVTVNAPAVPTIYTETTALTLTSNKVATDSKNFTFSGANLGDDLVKLVLASEVDGITLSTASVTPTAGAIADTEVTVSYKSLLDVAETDVNLYLKQGDNILKTIVLTYSSTAGIESLTSISAATTWNWKDAADAAYGTLGQNDMIVLANADVTWDAGFNALAIAGKLQHYYRDSKYAQGHELKFNTTIPGRVTVTFSNTGGKDIARAPRITDVNGSYAPTAEEDGSKNTTAKTYSHNVAAGDVLIAGFEMQTGTPANMLRFYKVEFVPTYTVAYAAGEHGSDDMTDANAYVAGDEVTLLANTFTPATGYVWSGWTVKDANNDDVAVSEGKFTMPASNVTVTAQWLDNSNVARIGDAYYTTFAEALTHAADGEIVLLQDIDVTAQIEIAAGVTATIDLAGHKIEYTGTETLPSGVILVHNGASLTINDSSDPDAGSIVAGEKAYAAIALTKAGDDATNPAVLVINGGTFTGYYYGITGNGSRPNTQITINGGTITGTVGIAIYHPQVGTLTVNNGSLTGVDAAIEMRAGTLVINDGTFTATATEFSCNPNGSGSTTSGAAIAIAQHTTKKDISVTINGGTFNGVKALNESNPQVNDPAPQVDLAVKGGDFTGEVSTVDVDHFISGGSFDAPVSNENSAEGFVPAPLDPVTGKFTVMPKDGVCLVKITPTSQTKGTQTGLYPDGDELTINLSSGMNLGGSGKYFGVKATENFQEGDVLHLNMSTYQNSQDATAYVYADKDASVFLFDTEEKCDENKDYYITMPAAVNGHKELYIVRTDGNKWNGGPSVMEVTRVINPTLTAITINGRNGVIDEANKTVSVTIPYDANLAALTVVPTIVWNAAAATNSIVVNDGSAWVEGPNSYKLTDKDGDYTVYTITLTRDVQKHAVKFYDGETLLETLEVEDGTSIAAGDVPADPTKEDYIFQGWAETAGGDVVDVTSFTISAAKNFYAVWAAETGVIKLLDGEGNVNTTDFITAVTAGTVNFDAADHNCVTFGSTASTVINQSGANKYIVYNARTNQTKIKFVLYNTNSSAQQLVLQKIAEGETAIAEGNEITIDVPSKERFETPYYTYNSEVNRTMYVFTKNTNIKVLQVKVVDDGAPVKQAGEAGYSLNLNVGRVFAPTNTGVVYDGLTMETGSNYKVLNSTEFQTTKNISFSISSPVLLKVTTNTAKYYVSQNPNEDGTTATEITAAGTAEFELTETTNPWYIVPSTTSNVKYTNIAFELPKAATPVIETQPATNHTFNPGDMTATVVATVTEGTLHYQWYKKATVGDDEEVGTDAATLTTTTEGTYYVVVTNVLAGHQNTSVTSDEAELGYRVTNDATLMALSYGGTAITLEDGVYTYDVELAKGTTDVPALAATATMGGYANVTIDNATEFVSYAASSTVTVKSEDQTVTKVYTVNFAVKHDLPQVDVTASTTWNWANAAETMQKILPETKNVEQLMANIDDEGKKLKNDAEFNSQALIFSGQEALTGNSTRWYAKGGHIKFNVTVPGKVTVEFSDNGTNNRRLKINNYLSTESSASETDVKTYAAYVQPGEVTLMGVKNDGTGVDQYIRISKIEFTAADESRANLQLGGIGTVCLPFDVATTDRFGGTFYKADYQGPGFAYFIEETGTLEAGKPYVYVADTTFIVLLQDVNANTVTDPTPYRGMYGTFTDMAAGSLTDKYVIAQKKLRRCGPGATLAAYRAYIDLTEMPTTPLEVNDPANAPVRRRLGIGGNNGSTTDLQNYFEFDAEGTQKVIMNGQLYILRDGKMYNAQGQLMK
ncbi:MAG: InlB B-repeat-containing protein [Paludibacteraceae bacterium]|nr:InlB B-repeat-containing protein [Paludibacteraceae bacterium]